MCRTKLHVNISSMIYSMVTKSFVKLLTIYVYGPISLVGVYTL